MGDFWSCRSGNPELLTSEANLEKFDERRDSAETQRNTEAGFRVNPVDPVDVEETLAWRRNFRVFTCF